MKNSFDDLSKLTIPELLMAYSAIINELRNRKITRSKNNPTGDYAEWLVSTKLGLTLKTNSAKGFDATDSQGMRYQIKGRQVAPKDKSIQLGVIRNLDGKDFDFLVAVAFEANWQIRYAAKIPHQAISLLASFQQHVNGHIVHLRPAVFKNQSVEDISHKLR